jgi:hypothetical protein
MGIDIIPWFLYVPFVEVEYYAFMTENQVRCEKRI